MEKKFDQRLLGRACQIGYSLASKPDGMSAVEVSDASGLARATAFRVLETLTESGFLSRRVVRGSDCGKRAKLRSVYALASVEDEFED